MSKVRDADTQWSDGQHGVRPARWFSVSSEYGERCVRPSVQKAGLTKRLTPHGLRAFGQNEANRGGVQDTRPQRQFRHTEALHTLCKRREHSYPGISAEYSRWRMAMMIYLSTAVSIGSLNVS
jgi:hypothetical protein